MPNNTTQRNYRTTVRSAPPKPRPGRMKIAFVCNDTKTLYLFRREAIIELLRSKYQVTIIAPFDDYAEYFIANGVRFENLILSRQGRNILEDYSSFKALTSIYKKLSPDLVFQYTIKINIYGTLAARKLKIPCISVVPGLGHFPDASNKLIKYLLARGYESAAEHSSEIWFLNAHDHGYFEAKGWLNHSPCRILPGEGINTNIYHHKPLVENKKINVLFLGRLLINKGARVFAETARLAKDLGLPLTFKMVGFIDESHSNGISSRELNSWTYKEWINYEGSTDAPETAIENSDIVVVPTSYREGLNRVIQEALAIGRPVITTSVPGAGELVEHNKTGYIVPPNDPDAILEVLQSFLTLSLGARTQMGVLGSKSVITKYDVGNVLPNYWDAIARHCSIVED